MNISILHTIVAVVYIILVVTEKGDDNISIRIARPENFVTLASMHLYDCQPIEIETGNLLASSIPSIAIVLFLYGDSIPIYQPADKLLSGFFLGFGGILI